MLRPAHVVRHHDARRVRAGEGRRRQNACPRCLLRCVTARLTLALDRAPRKLRCKYPPTAFQRLRTRQRMRSRAKLADELGLNTQPRTETPMSEKYDAAVAALSSNEELRKKVLSATSAEERAGHLRIMASTSQRTKRSTVGIATSQTSPEQDQPQRHRRPHPLFRWWRLPLRVRPCETESMKVDPAAPARSLEGA